MKSKLLQDNNGERTFALVFDAGDDVTNVLLDFARRQRLRASRIMGLGTFSRVTLGYFEIANKDYKRIPVEQQVEVVSLVGNISIYQGEPRLHMHVTIGLPDGTAMAGHLLEARVRPTLELMLVDSPNTIERTMDEGTGLPQLSF